MPLISAFGRQRQADLCEFEASQIYRASSRTGSKNLYRETPKERERERERMWDSPLYAVNTIG